MTGDRFNPDGLALSQGYARTMEEEVLPYLAARGSDHTVAGDGGKPLFCRRYDAEGAAGTVLIVHGFTENAYKYAELIHSLLRSGRSVLAYDQRGHGRSWRDPEIADLSLTHVEQFESYVADMEAVCRELLATMPKPWLLFAHSMGGAVSALFLERHPDIFRKAALCAPMIEANLGGLPVPAAELMCAGARALGKKLCPTCSKAKTVGITASDVKGIASAISEWTREAIRANRLILAPGEVEKIAVPVRVYGAENDNSVMPAAQEAFVRRLKDGKRTVVPGSKHEIYRSGDETVFPWWREVLAFYRE